MAVARASLHRAAAAFAIVAALVGGSAGAGGPLFLDENGDPFLWSTAQPIAYRTDGGNLSSQVTGAQAQTRVDAMFDAWQNVASSSIAYQRAGPIQAVARLFRRGRQHGCGIQRRRRHLRRRRPEPDHLRRQRLAVRGPRPG